MTICFNTDQELAKFCRKCIVEADRYSANYKFGYLTDIIIKPNVRQVEIEKHCNLSVEDTKFLLQKDGVKYKWVNEY